VPIAGLLAANYSWRTSMRIMAVFPLISLVAACFVVFRVKPTPRKPLSALERRFLRCMLSSRAFWTLYVSAALFSFTFFAALYIIVPFAASYGKSDSFYADRDRIEVGKAATLFTFFGVAKWIGSVLLGGVAHQTEARLVYAVSAGVVALTCTFWPLAPDFTTLAAVATVIGVGFSGMFATLPSMAAKCFAGPYAGLGIGATMSSFALGGFAGPPVILAIKTSQSGSYTFSFVLMAATTALSGAICFIAGFGALDHQDYASPSDEVDALPDQSADTVHEGV
jgi:MFS family permease